MLHSDIQALLDSLRTRIRRYVVWDSLLAILAVVLVAFWLGLFIDYTPVLLGGSEMPRSARTVLLCLVGGLVFLMLFRMLLSRLSRPLPDDSLALLVERQHPELGGRLITAVQLTRAGRSGDSHSPDLLEMVHEQASDSLDEVDPAKVFRMEPLVRKAAIAAPLLVMLLGFAVISPAAFARAAGRLTLFSDARWPRRAKLEMVGVDLPIVSAAASEEPEPARLEFDDNALRLPIGSSATLRIRAVADDAVVPSLCTVYYRTDDGTKGQSNMRRVGRERDGYQAFVLDGPPLANLSESFTFSVQGLDDRLVDYRIDAVEPPAITAMDVRVRYPDYLRSISTTDDADSVDFETEYQAGLRISEGSSVSLEAQSSLPLGNVDAMLEIGGEEERVTNLEFSEDRMSVRLVMDRFRSPTAIRLVPSDSGGISAQAPFRYFLGAVMDEPPTVSVSLRGIQSAVTPIALLPIETEVDDDYGVTSLQASVVRAAASTDESAEAVPQESEDAKSTLTVQMEPDRDGNAEVVIDLRERTNAGDFAPLVPGQSINVFAEASDGYDLDGKHVTSSESFRLQIVTAEELLTLMERRELGLRTRLEQTVTETTGLRDQLIRFRSDGFEVESRTPDQESDSPESEGAETGENDAVGNEGDSDAAITESERRQRQIIRLRVQQSSLQASKTSEELTGIAESLDDMLQEMVNNRVDSPDRQERLGGGVRDPLRRIVDISMTELREQIKAIENSVDEPAQAQLATETAVQTADRVLLELNAVLEKMLDLESYNELLDLVRGLIDDQEQLKEDTQKERKKRVMDLFND